jgi:redox-sensing transcriptional repressor
MSTGSRSRPDTAVPTSREPVSDLTTGRLSIYLRCLIDLESENILRISSQELARRYHLSSAQIRKDLANFGEFGIRGVGYDVGALRRHLTATLGLDRVRRMVIVGAGNLGMALADYEGFTSEGFRIVSMFDSNPAKAGRRSRTGVEVRPLAELERTIHDQQVEIGVIAVPASFAQQVYEMFVDAGICAILNFAPVQIRGTERVKVRSVDLRISLETLSFFLKQRDDEGCTPGPAGRGDQ